MTSFCRITGHARNLPKPCYFPLLPPISPADAKKLCRITGKASTIHSFSPLVSFGKPVRFDGTEGCRITKFEDFQYMSLIFEKTKDNEKTFDDLDDVLRKMKNKRKKQVEKDHEFVYHSSEMKSSIIFPPEMEEAIRTGELESVSMSKDHKFVNIKIKQGRVVKINLKKLQLSEVNHRQDLYFGRGQNQDVLEQQQELLNERNKRKANTMARKKRFEALDAKAEAEELRDTVKPAYNKPRVKFNAKQRAEKLAKMEAMMREQATNKSIVLPKVDTTHARDEELQYERMLHDISLACRTSVNLTICSSGYDWLEAQEANQAFNWLDFPQEELIDPVEVETTNFKAEEAAVRDDISNLDIVVSIETIQPAKPTSQNIVEAVFKLKDEKVLKLTEDVNGVLKTVKDEADIPSFAEISQITSFMEKAEVGYMVENAKGAQFVTKEEYIVSEAKAVSGAMIELNDKKKFVTGQVVNLGDQESFVAGQTIETPAGKKFVPGQTVLDKKGEIKFVPGQCIEKSDESIEFVAGQIFNTENGPQFIPGQMMDKGDGREVFVSGQTIHTEEGPKFSPGEVTVNVYGEDVFVPGLAMPTEEGEKFVAGQVFQTEEGVSFKPGQILDTVEGPSFVPGKTFNTPEGKKFIKGDMVQGEDGHLKFEHTPFEVPKISEWLVIPNKELQPVAVADTSVAGFIVNPTNMTAIQFGEKLYGDMVETQDTVQFYVLGKLPESISPESKVIPGQLIASENDQRFVPGKLMNTADGEKFVPGQVVNTTHGEEFIPGQIVESTEGPKFIPGQLVMTSQGEKFVPGQVIIEEEGPKFVPGQIIQTKNGATFIPGQMMNTDEGQLFVPGQLVETNDGPRFVPGQVVESPEGPRFIPGTIIETDEGLKYVPPDADEYDEEFEFSFQGFEVSAEELKLLMTNPVHARPHSSILNDECLIDTATLKKLADTVVVHGVTPEPPPPEKKKKKRARVQIDADDTEKMEIDETDEGIDKLEVLQMLLKASSCISETIKAKEMKKLSKQLGDKEHESFSSVQVDAMARILGTVNGTGDSFRAFFGDDELLISTILENIGDIDNLIRNDQAKKTLQTSIQTIVTNRCDQEIDDIIHLLNINPDYLLTDTRTQILLTEAVGIVCVTGNVEVASMLEKFISEPSDPNELRNNKDVVSVLRQLIVLHQMSDRDPEVSRILQVLQTNPEGVKDRRKVRQLLKSTKLLLKSSKDESTVTKFDIRHVASSKDIPTEIFEQIKEDRKEADKFLKMLPDELFQAIMKDKRCGDRLLESLDSEKAGRAKGDLEKFKSGMAIVVTKEKMQAVIPREFARSVCYGIMPYILIDEEGFKFFERGLTGRKLAPARVIENTWYMPDSYYLTKPSFEQEETTQEATTVATYLVKEDYSPEDSEGLAVVSGQKLILVDKSSPNKRPRLEGDEAGTQLLDNSAARHKMAIRPKRNHPDPRSRAHDSAEERWLMRDQESGKEGLVPSRILDLHSEFTTSMIASLKRSVQQIAMEETAEVKKNLMKEIREYKSRKSSSKLLGPSPEDEARAKRAATIRELIETEEEFVRDLEFVMENYYSLMDKNTTPRNVRDHKELIFNNFKFIADFHKNVLIEGVKYNVEVPKMIGKTFLRLERDFDKHAEYCSNEPLAQEFIENNIPVKEFFEEYSQKLGDDKRLQEHLKLPIQRLNDYQLLIRELVKYSTRLGDDPTDLQRAFELMQTIPQRATDAKFISSIEGFKGNLFKLGRLLRHDWFSVKEAGQKARDRYLFLFKARILITKVKRISEDRSIFILKDIIRLPETSLGSLDNPRAIEFFHIESLTHPNYPIFIEARTPEIREAWLSGIGEYVVDTASVEDLLFDDELRVVSQDVDEDDAGVVSPVPEVQEFEDLPEDGEAAEALQGQEDFWAREPSPPAKRQKPEAVPEETAEVDFWAQKESTPPRRQPVPGLAPAAEAAPEQVEESTPVAEQEKASAEQASFIPQEPSPSAQQTPKEKPEPSKPAEAKPESPKPAKVKPEPPKPAEVKRELPKPAEVKPEPPKPAEVKPEPPKPAEVKPEPPKPAEVKPEPPKPAEVKPEPPKPAEVKPEPPKPAEVKPEPPEPAEVSKQEPPKPQVQTRAPLAKLAAPAPHKMQEPTTPFTPGGTPKPVFTKTLKGDVVEPGDGVTFVCEVAHPAPYFITWLKDSKPLDDKLADRVQQTDTGAKHALKVLNCRVEDSGIYTAKATDENGVWSTCSAQLLVQELTEEERARRIAEKSPFFMVRMKPTQVIENTNLSYTIHVKGDPMPNVTFFKDDKELKEDARVTIHRDAAIGHYELLITHVQREDEGTYKCVATNKFGKAECEASMAVTDEEMLYESLSGKGSLLAKGEKAEFKWFRDGVEFDPHERFNVMFKDDEDTLALVFQNVTPEDAGLYTCVASTSCGKISCSAELTVEGSINRLQRDPEPPNFKEELTDTQVNVGGSAMLECRIGGYPKPELAWTRNGLDVKAGGRIKFLWEDEESVALIIKNCEEKDAGLYRVIAKNELGEVSCSAKLGIKAGPKIVSMKKEVACVVGQKLDYRVEVEGEPTPEIRWLKDGKQLMESDHIKFTKESDTVFVFKIDSMQMDDCCTYTVVASNPMGQVSEFFTIATDAAPQITRGLDPEIEKRYTYDIALEVRGTGSPKPMARWYKNGKEIMADDRFKMVVDESFYILKIRRLERKDKGTYCCELSNSSGTAKSEGVLSVRAPPDFVTPLKDACAKEGGKDVKMFVEWEANPMPTVKWFFNDKPIRDDTPGYTIRGQDTSMVLTIHEATEDVVGTYSVTATNEYGESVCKARFRLHEAPVVTEGLKDAEFLEDNSAKFTFKATGVPTPEIKWTKDGKKWSPDMHRVKLKQEGDDTFTLYFDEAKTEDSGHYVATISNVEGTVSTEASIVVNTDGRSSIAVAKCSKGAANDSGIHEQTVVDGGSLGEGKGLTGSASEASEGGSEKETVDASNKRKLITQEPVKVNKAKRGKKEVTVPDDLEIGNTENSQSCKKDAMVYKFTDVETETKIEDDQEKTVSKSVDMTVYDEIMQVEAEDSDESEENSTLIVRGFLEGTSSSEVPRGGLRVLASCSIHRQENVQKTVITAETDVGDDNVATSSIVHLKRTVDIENYKALVSESESDSESESRTLEKRDSRCALLLTKTPSVTVEEVPPAAGEALEAERGRAGPETDVNWNVIPETRSQRCLVDRDVPPVGEDADAVSKALDLAKSANSETADASSVLDEGKEKPGEAGLPRDAKAKKAKHERLSTGPLDASGAPPHIKGSNFRDGKTFIAMHKFVLEVEATAVPEAEATWYFNDKILSVEEDSVKFSFEGNKYTMERIGSDPEHSGQYKCVLKNKIKEVEEVGQVTVIEKEARVRRPLEDIYVKENTDATLKCQIVGDPIPSVEWLRNGKPLPPSERYEVSEERMKGWHTLVLKEVTEQDKSTFTVKGKNKHGECETSARLGVLVRPQPGELNDATVDYGKDLLLNVAIHAFPPPKMVWTLDGRELQEGDHYEYTRDEEKEVYGLLVHSAVLEDAGKITFTASNAAGSESGSCTVKVHTEKPAIVADLEDLSYCLEDDAVFTLRASGLPLPDVEWKLHDKVVKADERHVFTNPEPGVYCMTIKDVCMNDYGPVAVVAKSLVGECASAAKFSQKKIPCEVVEGLENVTKGAEGDDVTLTVKIRASPRPNFVWTKDSDICEASEKIVIEMKKTSYCEATISLTLVEASSIDSGQYRLKFQNELNEESTETALIVRPERRKPKITKPPKELQVLERKRGIFQAKVTGFPKPEVKWMKDGRQIYPTDIIDTGVTGDGFQYLEFKTVTMEDVGQYTIFASNEEGTAEAHAALIVVPPPSKPEFLQSLKASKVILGYPARMEVKLGGYPMPEVQWLKDGQPLNIDGTHYKQIVEPDGTVILQIDAATEGDMGEITCVAKNPEGDSQSSATLSVLGFKREDGQPDGPAAFTEGLKDMCFDEGMVMRLPVAMKGGPVPNMKWYKDGQEIKLDDRCFFTYDGDRTYLEIRPCKGSDSGMYKCVIQNSHGSAETECEVSIRKCYEAPFFTNTFTRMDKLPGSEVKMSVRYDGVPKPELSWFHNGEPILHDGDKYRIRKDGDGQTLTVKELTYSDSGAWKVVAKNREGETEHEAELNVSDDVDPNRRIEAPVFMKVIGDQELFEGYNALFKAVVSGKPEPEFKWLKNGGTIVASNRVIMERDPEGLIRLTIKRITPEDAGQYTLKVWNDYGEASCHGKLICETLTSRKKRPVGDEYKGFDRIRRSGVPMPLPEKPMISALADRRLTLSWMPHLAAPQTMPCTYQVEMCDAPDGDWFTVRTGIRGCSVDITNLMPKGDYKFRVRVANKYGVSEPSPYVATQRFKLELPAIRYEPQMDPNYEYKGDGPYVPEGFRISRDSLGNYFAAPRFLRLPHDTQYGLKGFNANIKWYAYGYPTPKVRFLKNGQPLEVGDKTRFKYSQEVTGEICLYIDRMTEADVGTYECLVRNEHGESRQRIKMDICEYPRVLEPLEEIHLKANSSGKIACRITGFPPCQVQWFRDWEPIAFTYKLRPAQSDPDLYFLHISGCQIKDSGLYSVAASNVAGTVHSSCMVHVEADDIGFFWMGPGSGRSVTMNNRRGTLEDHYDVGDELGRGTQGVVYHCVEHHTGRNFAAKSMWGKDQFKTWMQNEFEMMNALNSCKQIVRLYDAYEGPKNMVLVTELCGGGDLLGTLTQHQYLTEYEVCHYVRQILCALEYMHDRCIAHLGLNVGDILLTRPNGIEIKIGDLSLARNIRISKVAPLDYGMPEFVAPEVANGEGVTYAADMWSLGIITYLLLSGTSPFRGENDRETLTRVKKGEMSFDMEAFRHISDEAKDFIAKLLLFKPDVRMNVKDALLHPWIKKCLDPPGDAYKINTDRLKSYYAKFRDWYSNASCKRWFRRRTLASCFTHPSKMVYPPGEVYTPPESPERDIVPAEPEDYHVPHRKYSYELGLIKNESHYQMGPDTYLLQLRDVDFPCRLRSYMKVATDRSPAFAMSMRENDYDYTRIPIVHERRRFTDVMDEEIDDERKRTALDRYTAGFVRSRMETCSLDMPRRVKQEVPSRLSIYDEVVVMKEGAHYGTAPFLREKPGTCAITDGCPLTLTCVFTGDPEPVVQWFKNDIILGENSRVSIHTANGRSTLAYQECHDYDVGLYKVVARNTLGQATHRFRLVQGHIPGPCDSPDVSEKSDTEVLLHWSPPADDGGSQILCYHVQMKLPGDTEWLTVSDNIDHEFFLVKGLTENSIYQFRVAAKNFVGWGDFSVGTAAIRTTAGAPKVRTTREMQILQQATESGKIVLPFLEKKELDYRKETDPVKLKSGENAQLQVRKYDMIAELSRGRFSVTARCIRSDDRRHFAAKLLENYDREDVVREEFEVFKTLRHERIAQLYEAYNVGDVTVFIMEQLAGLDVLTYLASKREYSEQHVVTIAMQVLDALSYLHWRGMCHLDVQPDNVVLTTPRRCDVKLVDFGSTQRVSKQGSTVPVSGLLDFVAPEVLAEQKAFPSSDIWSLGSLIYLLLSGKSAFGGVDDEDTHQNILHVRYRYEHLGSNTTQEAIRFLMLIFKRDPSKRPTVDDCREHKWLVENDYIVKKRERATFLGSQLRDFDQAYHKERAIAATKSLHLLTYGGKEIPAAITYEPETQ